MATPIIVQSLGGSGAGSASPPLANLPVPPAAQPAPGDLLVAVLWDSSSGVTAPVAPGLGWTVVGSQSAPPGGVSGSRIMRVSIATRRFLEGDPTTGITPFSLPAGINNWQWVLYLVRGADAAVPAFTAGHGLTTDPVTALAPQPEGLLLATVAVPRSSFYTIGATLTYPDPPFTGGVNIIGTGFNAMSGGTTLIASDPNQPGPYQLAEFGSVKDAWVTALVSILRVGDLPRVRSSLSEDAGSLFQATQAVAVELGISEAFEYGTDVGGDLRAFREALTPNEVAVRYRPLPTRNQEMLTTVEGETNLGRLAHTIAPRIFTRGSSIPGNTDGIVTAQQAIQHVVNRWSSEHPWLVFEPVPDLRLLVPEAVAAPRQYYLDHPTAGVLTTSNVVIEQEGNDRRTMREVLDEWLQIFPGTIVRQTSRGTIEIVPRVGPDAPDGPALELTWRDFARFSDGEDDPRGIHNHARAISQGWDWVENQGLIPPSFTVVRGENGLERSVLDSEEVLPIDTREEFEPGAAVEFEVMTSQDAVEVDVGLTAFGSWSQSASSNFSVEGTTSHNFTLLPGQRRDVTLQHTSRSNNVVFRTRVTRAPEGDRITLSWPSGVPADARNLLGITFLAYEVTLDVGGTAWTRSNQSIEAEWGTEEHEIPAVGGGDALAQSRAQYGVRSATIQSNIFQLTPEQAMAVARGYVLHNINPRTVRDVQQSEWDRYPVKFDHIGRLVELPNGEVAVVENRSYSDSFAPRASAMMSSFTATVSHSVIDTTTEYLFNSDGSYWENDDGTISEVL